MSGPQTSGPAYQVVNPATGQVVETFDYATDKEIESALAAVHAGYAVWRDVPIAKRAKTVQLIGELFAERQAELGALATEETGKPLAQSKGEAAFCGEIFDYFATEGPELAADQPIKTFSGGTDDAVAAADLAWETRMSNTRQACNSNKRMIVMDDVYGRLTDLAKDLRPGDPAGCRGHLRAAILTGRGRAARPAGRGRRQQGRHPARGRSAERGAGGVLLPGGADRDHRGDARLPRGTVRSGGGGLLGLQRRRGPGLANDSDYGLGGAVFSKDTDRARKLAEPLEVGMSNVNTPAGEGAEVPFGGVKRSGFGRELGPLGMDEFVNKRMFYVAD